MTIQTILYFISILLTFALTGFLAGYAWRQPHVAGARSYAYMALAESLLALTEISAMLAGAQTQAAFWFSLRVPFAALIPVFWLFFALDYIGRSDWLSKPVRAALFAIPIITQVVMVTSGLHGLWLAQDVGFEKIGPFWIADTSARIPGFWYLVHTFYSTLLLVMGAGALVAAAWRKPKRLLGQALLISLGALTALGMALVGVFNLLPELRFNPFVPGIGFSAVCYALAIFRFQFLKRAPTQESGSRLTDLKPEEKGSLAVLVFIFILFVSGIAAIGYLTYQNYEKQFRAQVDNQLESIASLKADELQDWRAERLADANLFYRNENFSGRVRNYLEDPQDAEAQAKLLTWMEKIAASPEYDRVFLLDPQGVERISIPAAADPDAIPAALVEHASASLVLNEIIFLDFHRHSEETPIHLSLLVPIFDAQDQERLGVLILRIDPHVYLYPFLQRWPAPSASAETLLLRREGQEAVFLNALRFQPEAALDLRFPLTETQIPAVKAALGETGIVEGLDYRGVDVIADIRAVPGSPWFLVSKRDTAEVYAPVRERLWQTILLFSALILAAGAGLTLIWRQQRMLYYRAQAGIAESLRASEEKFRLAFETSPDSVAITRARDGMFVSVNKGFEQITGYKREEVVGKTSLGINIWKDPEDRRKIVEGLQARGEVRDYEAPFLTRDGEIVGLMSAAMIELDGEPHILNIVRDITERKRAEEALRLSEEQHRLISELISDYAYSGTSFPKGKTRTDWISGAFEQISGYTVDEMQALPLGFASLILPEDLENVLRQQQHLLVENKWLSVEFRIRKKDGEIRWLFDRMMLVPGKIEGGGLKILGAVQDITERKQAEQALRASEEKFRSYIQYAPDGVFISDEKGNYVEVNSAACHITGYSEDELLKLSIPNLLSAEDLEIGLQHFKNVNDKGFARNEIGFVTKSGEKRFWNVAAVKLSDTRFLGFVQDTTERKRAEEELKQSQALSKTIIDSIPGTFYMIDASGKYIGWNAYQRDEIVGQPESLMGETYAIDTIHLDDRRIIGEKIENVLKNGADEVVEGRVLLRGGPNFQWLLMTGTRVMIKDSPVLVGIGIDITKRKLAENAMRESEEKFRQAFNTSPIAISIARIKGGGFVSVNKSFEQMSGYSEAEIIGKTAEELHLWKSPEVHQGLLKELRDKGEVRDYETPILSRNGEIYCLTSASIIEINGEPHVLTLAVDITKRKRAEEALRESIRLNSSIMQAAQDIIVLKDDNFIYRLVNPAMCNLLGKTESEIIGKTDFDLFPYELAVKYRNDDKSIIESGQAFTYEEEVSSHEGIRYVSTIKAPVLDENNACQGIVVITRDITDRRQAEDALLQVSDRLALAQRLAGAGIWDWDLATGKLNWTPEFFSLFGLDPATSEATFDTWRGALYPDDIQDAEQRITEAIRDHAPLFNEYRIVTPSGETRWIGAWGDTTYNERGEALRMTGLCIDITARKRAENALRESEEEYRSLVQNIQVGVVVHAPDSSILFSNLRASQLLGLTPDQMRGKTAIDEAWRFIREDETRMPLDEYPVNQVLATNKPITNLILGILRPDREGATWVQCNAHQDWGLDGNLQQIVVSFADITERKLAEAALRESEQLFRQVYEYMEVGVARVSLDFHIQSANQAYCRMLGYSEAQLAGRHLGDFAHPETIEENLRKQAQLAAGEIDHYRMEKRFIHKDGRVVHGILDSSLIRDAHGKPAYFLGSVLDITERKQTEEALRESEDKFKHVFEYSTVGKSITQFNGRMQVNQALCDLLGYSMPEMQAKKWQEITHPDDIELTQREIDSLLSGEKESVRFVKRFLHKNGNVVWVDLSSSIRRDAQRQPLYLMSSVLDITERKRAEEILQSYSARLEAQVMERTRELRNAQEQLVRQERLATLGQLAGSIGHELRNPLGVISNAIYFLKMSQPEASQKVKEYLDIIEKETRTSDKIVTDLLDFTRIKSVDREKASVPELINQTLERNPAPPSVEVTLEIPAGLPEIYADHQQVVQVLGNLVVNACQAMTQGGKLTVSAAAQGDMIIVAVKDTGPGIPPENMGKLFQPLFTTKAKGIGLGLAVSRKLAEANGGRIEVESAVGQGSAFSVYLPVFKK